MKQDAIQLNLSREQIIEQMTGEQYDVFTSEEYKHDVSKEEALKYVFSGHALGIAQRADYLSSPVLIAHSLIPELFERSMAINYLLPKLRMVRFDLEMDGDSEIVEDGISFLVEDLHKLIQKEDKLLGRPTLNFLLHILNKLEEAAMGMNDELMEELCDTVINYLEVFYEGSRSVWTRS